MFGAVVVLYNPSMKEIENINTYINQVDYIVIIDNSDIDNSALVNKTINRKENILYIANNQNIGLAKALNKGVDILIEKKCEWALLLDADSEVSDNIISIYNKTLKTLNNNNIAVLSPVHLFDRSKNTTYSGYREVKWTMTSGCLFNCELFRNQGGFFEKLFVDGIDMDYCYKSIENGYLIIECGQAYINHNPAETRHFLWIKYGIASPFRYYMQARQLIWCWFRYKKIEALFIYVYKWLKILFLFPNKFEYIKEVSKGTRDGFILSKEEFCEKN